MLSYDTIAKRLIKSLASAGVAGSQPVNGGLVAPSIDAASVVGSLVAPPATSDSLTEKQLLWLILQELRRDEPKPQNTHLKVTNFPGSMSTVTLCPFDPTRTALMLIFGGAWMAAPQGYTNPFTTSLSSQVLVFNRHDHIQLCTAQWNAFNTSGGTCVVEVLDRTIILGG